MNTDLTAKDLTGEERMKEVERESNRYDFLQGNGIEIMAIGAVLYRAKNHDHITASDFETAVKEAYDRLQPIVEKMREALNK